MLTLSHKWILGENENKMMFWKALCKLQQNMTHNLLDDKELKGCILTHLILHVLQVSKWEINMLKKQSIL